MSPALGSANAKRPAASRSTWSGGFTGTAAGSGVGFAGEAAAPTGAVGAAGSGGAALVVEGTGTGGDGDRLGDAGAGCGSGGADPEALGGCGEVSAVGAGAV